MDFWHQPMVVKLVLKYNDNIIFTSDTQTLSCPVRPHNGVLLPLDQTNNGERLTYQGNTESHPPEFYGRMFEKVDGFNKYLFKYAGVFETDINKRGFDCITYAGTTCGASIFHMADAEDLANSLNATEVSFTKSVVDEKTKQTKQVNVKLTNAEPADVKLFFADNKGGYFLLYSSGHVVIVANNTVYEFHSSQPSGYNKSPILDWLDPYKHQKLTLRKLPGKPALAA